MQWKAGRDNIKIRSVALNEAELEAQLADPRIDVVTAYHGRTNFIKDKKGGKIRTNTLYKIVKAQNPQLSRTMTDDELLTLTDKFQDMGDKSKIYKAQRKKNPGKLCCEGGKCSRDSTKCGFGLNQIIPGVILSGALIQNLAGEKFDLTEN